jgi:hypothetical protein
MKITSDTLDNMAIKDIEALRKDIYEREGRFETFIRIDHPEANILPTDKQTVLFDILQIPAFFYPSGVV